MCLYTHNMIANVADEDIVCYKIMKTSLDEEKGYFSPYMDTMWEIGKEYNHDSLNYEELPLHYGRSSGEYAFSVGYYHSFKNITDAIAHTNLANHRMTFGSICVVMKCVIPKGTEYYEGDGAFNCYREDGYASRNIKTVEVVH